MIKKSNDVKHSIFKINRMKENVVENVSFHSLLTSQLIKCTKDSQAGGLKGELLFFRPYYFVLIN